MKLSLRYSPMSPSNICTAESNLEVLPLTQYSNVQFSLVSFY